MAQRIDEVLQTDGFFDRMRRKLIHGSPYAEYFRPLAELQALATRICEFAPTVVPGLLRTAAYARVVTVAADPFVAEEYVEEKATASKSATTCPGFVPVRDSKNPAGPVLMIAGPARRAFVGSLGRADRPLSRW